MSIEFTHLHNLVRTYQRALPPNESPKTSNPNAEVDDHVSISDEARDEHRQRDVTVDGDSEPGETFDRT
jgi:hypothetical protein